MGIPVTLTMQFDAADANGIAAAQTLSGAGNVTLNGILVSNGVAVLCDPGLERPVIITSTGDDTGITFTISGTNATGNNIDSSFAGASAGGATSPIPFRTVSAIRASGATDGNIEAGTTSVGYSRAVSLNYHAQPVQISFSLQVAGTVDFDLEYTLDEINQWPPIVPNWLVDTDIDGDTSSIVKVVNTPMAYARVKINSGDGTITATILQAGLIGGS